MDPRQASGTCAARGTRLPDVIRGPERVLCYVLFGCLICVLCYLGFNNMLFFDAHKMSICPICKLQAAINQINLSKLDFYMFYNFCPMYWIEK